MTEIPNAFGGFAPFPNTIMIPTMGLQSAVIGYRFGFGYEQGKRTLRAMSNEQFNTLDEEAEQAIFKRHDAAAINYFKVEMHNWVELQNLIIEKSVEIEVMKANRTPSAFREIFEGFTKGFTSQQVDDAKKFFDSLADPVMKLIAWFSGKPTTTPTSTTISTPTPTPQPAPIEIIHTHSPDHHKYTQIETTKFRESTLTWDLLVQYTKQASGAKAGSLAQARYKSLANIQQNKWDVLQIWIKENSSFTKYGEWIKDGQPKF